MDNQRLFTLLGGTARRDPQAFTQLYQEFYPAVYGMALSVLKKPDASADAAQEVFLRLWTLPAQSFPTANPGAWLYTVTRRQAWRFKNPSVPPSPWRSCPLCQTPPRDQSRFWTGRAFSSLWPLWTRFPGRLSP